MRIWLALLVAPLIALADQSVNLALASWACAERLEWAAHLSHGATLLLTLAATGLAWSAWREQPRGGREPHASRRFLAGIAIASAALSASTIAAMWIATWMLSPCYA
jgi:hypothetical protein